jgi:hypothetical protein
MPACCIATMAPMAISSLLADTASIFSPLTIQLVIRLIAWLR